jgi:hypothetical protein
LIVIKPELAIFWTTNELLALQFILYQTNHHRHHLTKKMAQVKNPTDGTAPSDIPVAAAFATPATDVESQFRQEYTAPEEFGDERAGMGMGIALFVLLLVGLGVFITSFNMIVSLPNTDTIEAINDDAILLEIQDQAYAGLFFLGLTTLSLLVAIVIASVLACGCCCASKYKLKPHVKKWATATLVSLCLLVATDIVMGFSGEMSRTAFRILGAFYSVLLLLALVFSGLFTWGRSSCAPRFSG